MTRGVSEAKKQDMRDRLSLATVRLAREQGLDNVRVADVVELVGVSRRTFSNYFSSKQDAIADRHVQRAQLAARALLTRDAEEPLWAGVTAVILDQYAPAASSSAALYEGRQVLLQILSDPAMRNAVARGSQAAVAPFEQSVAVRLGVDADLDIRPRLIANAAVTTPMLAVERWLRVRRPVELRVALRDAFAMLGSGFERIEQETPMWRPSHADEERMS